MIEGNEIVGKTTMDLLDSVERNYGDDYKIVECGIVIVLESNEKSTCRIRTSNNRYYVKRGIWEWALETLKDKNYVD